MRILVIDDNPSIRATLKLVLGSEFEGVTTAGDPKLLPALLSGGDFDVVVLDMNFGNSAVDGSEGLFWLKRIKGMENPPAVVVITAFGEVELAVEAMKNGAEDFVTKPWDNSLLIEKIKKAWKLNDAARKNHKMIDRALEITDREEGRKKMTLDQLKQEHAKEVLSQCGGNMSVAARQLGITRQSLYNLLKEK